MCSKATKKERKEMMVSEVIRMESFKVKGVGQRQQGKWTTGEAVTNKAISWADMWKIPQASQI